MWWVSLTTPTVGWEEYALSGLLPQLPLCPCGSTCGWCQVHRLAPRSFPQSPGWHLRQSWMRCARQPGLEQLRNVDACSLSCKCQHGKLESWVREWRVPGCSGQHRCNLDLMRREDRVGIYICVCSYGSDYPASWDLMHALISPTVLWSGIILMWNNSCKIT